jgi:ribulose 1,5-bisphosphate carboxylase large subunit-like protein
MVKDLGESGKETAKTMYKSRGWVAHHNTDIWRITGVIDFANAGMWPWAVPGFPSIFGKNICTMAIKIISNPFIQF